MLLHPTDEIGSGRESLATGKDLAQTIPGAPGKFFEKAVDLAIDIAQEREIKRVAWGGRSAIGANVIERAVIQNDQPREMKPVELGEGDERVGGVYSDRKSVV